MTLVQSIGFKPNVETMLNLTESLCKFSWELITNHSFNSHQFGQQLTVTYIKHVPEMTVHKEQ